MYKIYITDANLLKAEQFPVAALINEAANSDIIEFAEKEKKKRCQKMKTICCLLLVLSLSLFSCNSDIPSPGTTPADTECIETSHTPDSFDKSRKEKKSWTVASDQE